MILSLPATFLESKDKIQGMIFENTNPINIRKDNVNELSKIYSII